MARRISTEAPRPVREDGRGPVVDSRERIAESYAAYLADESRSGPASCDRIVFARSEREVADALLDAAAAGSEVTVSGARTGIVGGAVPRRGTVLSLVEMNRVLGVRRLDGGVAGKIINRLSMEKPGVKDKNTTFLLRWLRRYFLNARR